MKPPVRSFPRQNRSNSSTSTPPQQQVFTSNMLQNSVPMQPQMGIINPLIPFPLNSSNVHAMAMPNVPQTQLLNQPNFMNAPNPLLFSQNNNLGLPQLGPIFGNFGNLPQNASQGQIIAPNLSNFPQQFSQTMGLQNSMQNVHQILSMQMPNPGLFGNSQVDFANCNGTGQQINQNRQNFVQRGISSCSSGAQQSQNSQPYAFMRPQGKSVQNGQSRVSNSNWKNAGKNFKRNPTGEPSRGFHKSQFHQMDRAKRKFGFHNDHRAKGRGNGKAVKFDQGNHMNQPQEQKRKSIALTYTEQEIKQWCEERRKNYPTKANINKKLTEKQLNSKVIDEEAKMRREQLKEILARQAELGVEVAEIPVHYLSDSKKPVHGREETVKPLNKRGRFQSKHDKRGRYNRKEQFAKRQKLANNDSSNTSSSFNKRKPTLLQQLLSKDIKRDKSHLLQAFRFMVMNSFFKDWPEKPLNFPLVRVKESGVEGKVVENKSFLVGKDACEGSSSRTTVDSLDHDDNENENGKKLNHNIQASDDEVDSDDDENDNNGEDNDDDEQMKFYNGGKGSMAEENVSPEEEEGEIID